MTVWCQSLPTFHSRQAFEVRLNSCIKSHPGCLLLVYIPWFCAGSFHSQSKRGLDWVATVELCHRGYQNKKVLCSMKQCHACMGSGHHASQPASSFALTPHPHRVSAHSTGVNVLNMWQHIWQWQCAVCRIFDRSLWWMPHVEGVQTYPQKCLWHKTRGQSPIPMSKLARWSLLFQVNL